MFLLYRVLLCRGSPVIAEDLLDLISVDIRSLLHSLNTSTVVFHWELPLSLSCFVPFRLNTLQT